MLADDLRGGKYKLGINTFKFNLKGLKNDFNEVLKMKMTYEQFKQANYEMVVKQIQNTLKNRAFRETGKLVYNENIEKDVKNILEKLINNGIVNPCTFEICHESEIL